MPFGKAHQRQRPIAQMGQQVRRDAGEVDDEVALGEGALVAVGGPEDLVEVAEGDLVAVDLEFERFASVLLEFVDDLEGFRRSTGRIGLRLT